jgi:hypothetical protein
VYCAMLSCWDNLLGIFSCALKSTKKANFKLGAVYTMDHEIGPRLCKAVDWLLKLSRDNFGLHQEINGKGTMEVEVPRI